MSPLVTLQGDGGLWYAKGVSRALLISLVLVGAAGCVGETSPLDGGDDSGARATGDAGRDGGLDAGVDAGAEPDAGPAPDAGGLDAGAVDAGPRLPPIDRPLWLGYFKVHGRYGDFTTEATRDAGNMACVFANQGDFDTAIQDPIALTAKAAADLNALGAGIVIAGGAAEIDAAQPYWAQVVALYVTGEATGASPLDSAPCEAQAAAARAHVQTRALPNRPIICYYDTDISVDPTGIWRLPAGIDWIGVNAYLGPAAPATTADALTQLRDRIRRQMNRLPAGKPAIIMAQAYDRNGAWADIPMLEAMQPVYLDEARLDARIRGIWWFSYSRPGGTLTHRALRKWHEAVFRANVMGRPAIEVPP